MERMILIYFFALTLVAGALASCAHEDGTAKPDPLAKGMKEISLNVAIPRRMQISTRTETGTVAENKVDNFYVLVFDKGTGQLITKARGKEITPVSSSTNENEFTCKATLPVGTEYTFMVLANAESYLTGIHTGVTPAVTRNQVLNLTVQHTEKWNTSPIPMWAERDLNLTATDIPSFELTRMLARVNVEVQLRDDSGGNPVDNFRLTSVRYYNYNTYGALVPADGNYNSTAKKVTAPTIPATPGTQMKQALLFDGSEITDQKACTEKIYVFEATHNGNTYYVPANNGKWIENPCLVIGGQYKKDDGTWLEETFYRVDFIRKDLTDPQNPQDIWLSVLRNFSYNVFITQVSGAGFDLPEIALESAPINMEANVIDWNESDMGEIVFDGVFYLSVSQDKFNFGRRALNAKEEDNILYVKTDYIFKNNPNDETSGWYVEKYVDAADGTTEVSWLRLIPGKGAANVRVEAYFEVDENTSQTNREAIVWIAAGRLRYPVYVRQGVLSLEIIDPDANNQPISEIRFVVPKDLSNQPPRKFQVNWTPVNKPVTITQASPQVWNPFEPGWLDPDPSLTWGLAPGGTQLFEVNPPTVLSSDIDTDPFYERESTYFFHVENEGEQYTDSINIHQVYYNILVDTYPYRLDGLTYTLSVRSNTNWVITNIEEWLYNNDPATDPSPTPKMLQLNTYDNLKVGTFGGPDINGTSVAFTVVNQSSSEHLNKWGTVYVTFESPDGKFDPERVALRFPPNKLRVLALGYSRDWRGYHVGLSNPYHTNTAFQMLITDENFGDSPESTVYVRSLDVVGFNAQETSVVTPDLLAGQWGHQQFIDALNENPDILVVTYSTKLNTSQIGLISDFIDNGGVAIIMLGGLGGETGTYYAQPFLRAMLEDNQIVTHKITSTSTVTDVYQFPTGDDWLNDPILDGPFGDLRGKHWGAHERSIGFKTPNTSTYDKIEIMTWSQDNMYSIFDGRPPATNPSYNCVVAFRHKTRNLIWIGCDTFTSSLPLGTFHGPQWDPFTLNAQFKPAVRSGFGKSASGAQRYDTYNSYAMANMLTWAISVTHHRPPPGGY